MNVEYFLCLLNGQVSDGIGSIQYSIQHTTGEPAQYGVKSQTGTEYCADIAVMTLGRFGNY